MQHVDLETVETIRGYFAGGEGIIANWPINKIKIYNQRIRK